MPTTYKFWQAPTDQFLDELADRMLRNVKHRKVKCLVIDGLGGFKKALRSRPIEPFFSALVHELRTQGVTSICGPSVLARLSIDSVPGWLTVSTPLNALLAGNF